MRIRVPQPLQSIPERTLEQAPLTLGTWSKNTRVQVLGATGTPQVCLFVSELAIGLKVVQTKCDKKREGGNCTDDLVRYLWTAAEP